MKMSRFDWSVRVVKNLCRLMSAMWFNSNALEVTTAEHCMYLTKFCELLVCSCMWYSSGEFNHNKAKTSQFCKKLEPAIFKFYKNLNWSLHYSKSKGMGGFKTES